MPTLLDESSPCIKTLTPVCLSSRHTHPSVHPLSHLTAGMGASRRQLPQAPPGAHHDDDARHQQREGGPCRGHRARKGRGAWLDWPRGWISPSRDCVRLTLVLFLASGFLLTFASSSLFSSPPLASPLSTNSSLPSSLQVIQRALEVQALPGALPAQLVRPGGGKLRWVLDLEACADINPELWDSPKNFPRSNVPAAR